MIGEAFAAALLRAAAFAHGMAQLDPIGVDAPEDRRGGQEGLRPVVRSREETKEPGAYLIFIHAHLAFAAFETCFNAGARFDDARQFPKRWLLKHHPASLRRREVILVAMSGV